MLPETDLFLKAESQKGSFPPKGVLFQNSNTIDREDQGL